ncbi:metalloprotease [Aquimarina sp. TRL1]|uniref:metalloprotease n=1 Tax=Aquimarina sp. (strain TRL1) TaxID=2736252 RepID=UPI0020CAA8D4|nr:metalloprotease [Aquimarina sp. TRL1]
MRNHRFLHIVLLYFAFICTLYSQHQITISSTLYPESNTIQIEQEIVYNNTSNDTLASLYLNDWANSFSSKTTPLGKRFSEDFLKRFHYAKEHERGYTAIKFITADDSRIASWKRYDSVPDIVQVQLRTPLLPSEKIAFRLQYDVKLPSDKFTRYGYHDNGDFSLKYWYISPSVYTNKWNTYSNKNLNDLYNPLSDLHIKMRLPSSYKIHSELQQYIIPDETTEETQTIQLTGKQRNKANLYIEKDSSFYDYQINDLKFISNIDEKDIAPELKSIAIHKILTFLEARLGKYPFEKIITSQKEYKNSPVYGLNQLPDILRPFPDGFQYEIKQLKTISKNYIENTLLIDPRYDAWIKDAIHVYLMIAYTEQYYPEMKMIGNLSKIIGVRWFHAADLDFNDQYFLGYKNVARLFLDQSLTTPQDKLVKFNKNIANAYKAGVGFKYLEDYLEDDNVIPLSIQKYYSENLLKLTDSKKFEATLSPLTPKNIEWFFEDYINTNSKIDFKFKSVKKREDSIEVTIKNKSYNAMPVSVVGLRKKEYVSKTWVTDITGTKTIKIPNEGLTKLVLDYDQKIPETNRRDNYRNLKWIQNKPFQFRFFQDIEDPTYNQIFFIPEFEFNVYDGFTIGSKFHNKTVIRRPFNYNITPSYGFKSQKLLGSASLSYRRQIADYGLYQIRYGISGNTYSYAPDLLYQRVSPFISFSFRPEDLRSNQRQRLTVRSVNVFRERAEENPVNTPDYSVFNTRYLYSDNNLLNIFNYSIDYQLAKNFSKLSTTFKYRKIFLNNRQLNLRLFAGTFIFNDTSRDGDFFSFALDRPTDYLFDYSYLGRSESTGLVSQQIILAEGGFKSKLDYSFSNQWLTTFNADSNIWKWIFAYGDVGFVKNKGVSPKFVFDTGIRLSLVADYFEVFLPIASNNGWEIAQPNYNEKIRFIITLSPQTLISLFTREWY